MKKIIAVIAIFALVAIIPSESKAQITFDKTASNPTGAITNAGIDTSTYTFTKGYPRILFGMTYTRTANTAAGTAILEYRLSSSDNWKSDAGDTLTVTNVASQTLYWNKTVPARRWRVRVGGATTVTATVAVRAQVAD